LKSNKGKRDIRKRNPGKGNRCKHCRTPRGSQGPPPRVYVVAQEFAWIQGVGREGSGASGRSSGVAGEDRADQIASLRAELNFHLFGNPGRAIASRLRGDLGGSGRNRATTRTTGGIVRAEAEKPGSMAWAPIPAHAPDSGALPSRTCSGISSDPPSHRSLALCIARSESCCRPSRQSVLPPCSCRTPRSCRPNGALRRVG
jgi:hypothetical protein